MEVLTFDQVVELAIDKWSEQAAALHMPGKPYFYESKLVGNFEINEKSQPAKEEV